MNRPYLLSGTSVLAQLLVGAETEERQRVTLRVPASVVSGDMDDLCAWVHSSAESIRQTH